MPPPSPSLALVLAVLVSASAASIMSTDLYTPSLPSLAEYFDTSARMVQLTIGLNLMAFALAQLVHGPCSDRFGRRPVMLAGLALFTASSAACALADSVEQLIAARVVQGFAASVEAVVGLAVVRDLFHGTDRVRAYAIWGIAVAAAPAAAPIIGGHVYVAFGWQMNFWLVAAVGGVVTAVVWRFLPESTVPDRGALDPPRLVRAYAGVLADRSFLAYAMLLGTGLGIIFAFITAGPFLLIDRYGVRPDAFGYYQAGIVAAYLVGSLATDRLASRVNHDRLLGFGIAVSMVGAVALTALLVPGFEGPLVLSGAMSLVAFGLGPVFAIAPAKALDQVEGGAGVASALIGTLQTGTCGLAAAAVTALHDGSPAPLVWVSLALMLVGYTIYRRARAVEPGWGRY